jgi:uncharacterized protein (TIGR02453 family)
MIFNGFKKEALELLVKFEENNSKEYFESRRSDYEKYILEPNKAYVQEMGEVLQILVPHINAVPKINKSLFKIYRDSRFHPSEPIKSKIGIIIWQGAGHRMQSSSFYMHYSKDELFVATGIRNFKPPLLAMYREYIQDDTKKQELHQILEELKAKGYNVLEPKFKRYPKDLSPDDTHSYLYKMGAMYAYKILKTDSIFFSEKIVDRNFKIYQDMFDLHQWVYEMTLLGR